MDQPNPWAKKQHAPFSHRKRHDTHPKPTSQYQLHCKWHGLHRHKCTRDTNLGNVINRGKGEGLLGRSSGNDNGACMRHGPKPSTTNLEEMLRPNKNIDVMRFHLKDQMLQWAAKNGCFIDGAVNIPEQLLTDIATLKFNPGASLMDSTWVGRGLTIMCCLSYKPGAWDDIQAEEEGARATAATRTLAEELKRSKGVQRTPLNTHADLCIALDTFCVLIWTLFGNECNYYKGLLNVRNVLLSEMVLSMRSRYTPHTICSYFWAIIDDGREYLGTKLLKQHFMTGTLAFPSSLLYDILHDIRFQRVTVRNNFPPAWIVQPQVNPPTYQQDATQHQPATQQQKRGNNQRPTAKWGTQPTQQQGGLPPPPTVAKPSSWGNVARQIKPPVEE
jgi:hypothetical protein